MWLEAFGVMLPRCQNCQGNGWIYDSDYPKPCQTCQRAGWIVSFENHKKLTRELLEINDEICKETLTELLTDAWWQLSNEERLEIDKIVCHFEGHGKP